MPFALELVPTLIFTLLLLLAAGLFLLVMGNYYYSTSSEEEEELEEADDIWNRQGRSPLLAPPVPSSENVGLKVISLK